MGMQIIGYDEDENPQYGWVDEPSDYTYTPTQQDQEQPNAPGPVGIHPDGGVDASGNPTYVDQSGNPVNADGTPIANANERVALEGGGFKTVNPNGSVTYQDPDGSVYTVNPNGTYSTESEGQTWTFDPKQNSFVDAAGNVIGAGSGMSAIMNKIKSAFQNKDGTYDWKKIIAAGTAAASLSGLNKPATRSSGYQGGIPSLQAIRSQLPGAYDPNRRAGSGGQRYFSDMSYVGTNDAAAQEAAKQKIAGGVADIMAQNKANPAYEARKDIVRTAPRTSGMLGLGGIPIQMPSAATAPNSPAAPEMNEYKKFIDEEKNIGINADRSGAQGGFGDKDGGLGGDYLNRFSPEQLKSAGIGSIVAANQTVRPIDAPELNQLPVSDNGETYMQPIKAAKGMYLRGSTDGMADKLDTTIDDTQPAKLSHGEFVIPADVVSHLGNGNSDAGAKKLYQMMDKIRMARTGTKKQGKQINPDKFMPGGLASMKTSFPDGGSVGTNVGSAVNAGVTGTESNLSNWAGPYVTNMLGQAQALGAKPYEAYQGPLTAGTSGLQTEAFQNAMNLNVPTQNMGGFAPQTFGTQQAQQYMNPYLQAALEPQLAEQRRQAQINLQPSMAKLTQAGGFGGGRQAIMESEANRNLQAQQNQTIGQGYMDAYNKAMQQFNAEQGLGLQAQQATNQYGLQALQQQAGLGAQQRGIESEGIAADIAQFEQEKLDPYKKLQFQQSMLQGMPVQAQQYNVADQSTLQKILGVGSDTTAIYKQLQDLGVVPK